MKKILTALALTIALSGLGAATAHAEVEPAPYTAPIVPNVTTPVEVPADSPASEDLAQTGVAAILWFGIGGGLLVAGLILVAVWPLMARRVRPTVGK